MAQLATVPWEQVSLVVWQAPLPQGDAARPVQSLVERGGQAIFLPPRTPDDGQLFGVKWQSWASPGEDIPVDTWRGDQDLLAHVLSGEALPVGELHVRKYCKLSGEAAALATLRGGAPLIARVATNQGGVYFWTTTPAPADSSLAADGVVLYVALQRALAAGSEGLGNTRNLTAGRMPAGIPTTWKRLAGADQALSTDYVFHQGVYTAGERLLAVHRAAAEDRAAVLDQSRAAGLFRGLDFARVDDLAGNANSLIQEIWRLFLAVMIVAMIGEAGLCLPRQRPSQGTAT